MAHQLRPVYRALNKPLTLLWIDRRLFFCVVTVSAAVFNLFAAPLPGVVLFLILWGLARLATQADPQLLRILINANRFATRSDPAKWSATRLEKGKDGPSRSADEQLQGAR